MKDEDAAIMLRALILMDVKMDKFDELMPDALSEYLGSELWALRSVLFTSLGFPEDTYETTGYDDEDSFCDDGLHDFVDDLKYLVSAEEYIDAEDCRLLDYRGDPTLQVFIEKVNELKNLRDGILSRRGGEG